MTATTLTAPSSLKSDLPAGLTTVAQDAQSKANNSGTLLQSDFLKLMTAQLKNQDPLQPMDNGQFLGQMAQFSTVSSLGDMATQLKGLSEQFVANRLLSSGSLIGRQVMSTGNTATLEKSHPLEGAVRIDQPVDSATIYIRNSTGQLVDTMQMGPAAPGEYPFSWDGFDSAGNPLDAGQYRVDVSVNRQGKSEAVTPRLYTPINSVSMQGSDIVLNLGSGAKIPLSQVTTLR